MEPPIQTEYLALRAPRGHNLDIHGGRREGGQLLGHALADALEHGGAAGEDDVGVQVLCGCPRRSS